jgi:hypothetical protein
MITPRLPIVDHREPTTRLYPIRPVIVEIDEGLHLMTDPKWWMQEPFTGEHLVISKTPASMGIAVSEFWESNAEFVRHYSRHRANAMDEWRTAAARLVTDPEKTVAAIGAAFPMMLDKHFGFDVTLFQRPLPERLQVDLLTLADQQNVVAARQQAAQRASEKISAEVETFVADCVASLREQGGTRNRALSIIKSRGSTHSNQQRKLIFSDMGTTVGDPPTPRLQAATDGEERQ